jgi:hypothetical protein
MALVDNLTGSERDSYLAVLEIFKRYGLETLAPKILEYVRSGYSEDTMTILLQDTDEYKQRFAANDARRAAGLRVLSPAEYLQLESAYHSVVRSAGLPQGFYDSPDDFKNWIAGDVDPTEVRDRVQMWSAFVGSADPTVKQVLRDYYNVGDAELVAYYLDEKRALPILERQAQAVVVGAAARKQGLSVSESRARYFADLGAAGGADQAYGQVASILQEAKRLNEIHAGSLSQEDVEDELLGGLASARRKREQLAGQEAGLFSGSSGLTRQTLGKSTTGSY